MQHWPFPTVYSRLAFGGDQPRGVIGRPCGCLSLLPSHVLLIRSNQAPDVGQQYTFGVAQVICADPGAAETLEFVWVTVVDPLHFLMCTRLNRLVDFVWVTSGDPLHLLMCARLWISSWGTKPRACCSGNGGDLPLVEP